MLGEGLILRGRCNGKDEEGDEQNLKTKRQKKKRIKDVWSFLEDDDSSAQNLINTRQQAVG